jgi:hypothetical protein
MNDKRDELRRSRCIQYEHTDLFFAASRVQMLSAQKHTVIRDIEFGLYNSAVLPT